MNVKKLSNNRRWHTQRVKEELLPFQCSIALPPTPPNHKYLRKKLHIKKYANLKLSSACVLQKDLDRWKIVLHESVCSFQIYEDNCLFSSSSKFWACLCLYINFIPSFHFPPNKNNLVSFRSDPCYCSGTLYSSGSGKHLVTSLASRGFEIASLRQSLVSGGSSNSMPSPFSLWGYTWSRGTTCDYQISSLLNTGKMDELAREQFWSLFYCTPGC